MQRLAGTILPAQADRPSGSGPKQGDPIAGPRSELKTNKPKRGTYAKRAKKLQARLAAHPATVEGKVKAAGNPKQKDFKYQNDDGSWMPKFDDKTKGHVDAALGHHAAGEHGKAVGEWLNATYSVGKNNVKHAKTLAALGGAAGVSHGVTKHFMKKGFEDAAWKYGVPAVGGAAAVGYLANNHDDRR
jgi:hypothetical protein